ncbi:MAG: hypothetical protein ACPLRS_02100, partial [Hydrogenobacter sp.]
MSKKALLTTLAFLISSCAQMTSGYVEPYNISQAQISTPLPSQKEEEKTLIEEKKRERVIYERDYERSLPTSSDSKRGNISIHFDDISLLELLNEVFYKTLGVSYSSPSDLNQRVSVHLNNLTKDQLISYMQDILSLYGYSLSEDKGRLMVLPSGKSPLGENLSALIYSPENVAPSSLSQAFSAFVSPAGKIIAQQRLLVIIDYKDRLIKLRKLLSEIDTPFYRDKKIAFIKTKVDANQIRDN